MVDVGAACLQHARGYYPEVRHRIIKAMPILNRRHGHSTCADALFANALFASAHFADALFADALFADALFADALFADAYAR